MYVTASPILAAALVDSALALVPGVFSVDSLSAPYWRYSATAFRCRDALLESPRPVTGTILLPIIFLARDTP